MLSGFKCIFISPFPMSNVKILTVSNLMKQSGDSDDTYICIHTSRSFCSHLLLDLSLKIFKKIKVDTSTDFLLLCLSWCYYGSSHQFRAILNASIYFWHDVTERCSKSGRQSTKNTVEGINVLFPIFHVICCSCSLPHMTRDMKGLFLFANNIFFCH